MCVPLDIVVGRARRTGRSSSEATGERTDVLSKKPHITTSWASFGTPSLHIAIRRGAPERVDPTSPIPSAGCALRLKHKDFRWIGEGVSESDGGRRRSCQATLRVRRPGPDRNNGRLRPMATVAQLLERKGHNVESISPDATVYDAIRRMADLDIGALVVVEGGKVVGLISERDYARNVFLKGKASPNTPVKEAMTDDALFVGCEDTTRDCMAIMTGKRTRHLLVMEGGQLLGILSIGDLVRSIVAEQDMTIEQLEQYILRG